MKKSSLPREEECEEGGFLDLTEDFYDYLYIPKDELITGSGQERIKQFLIIISGTMGIGKTKLVENIVHKLREYYKEKGLETNVVLTRVSTTVLMDYAFRGNPNKGWNAKCPIQILIFDDATSVKLTLEDQRRLVTLRHRMEDETELKEGIIYSILVTHDWYRLDPNFRRNALLTCFLSISPLDRFSRNEYSKFLGKTGIEYLTEKLPLIMKFDKNKGTGLIVLPFRPALGEEEDKVGLIKWSNLTDIDYIIIKRNALGRLVFTNKIQR